MNESTPRMTNLQCTQKESNYCGMEKNGGIKRKKDQGKNRNDRLNNAFGCLENYIDGHFICVLEELVRIS